MERHKHEQLCLQNPRNFSALVCCETYIAVQYNLLRHLMQGDDFVDEDARKGRGVRWFPAGWPMCSICHVVEEHRNSVVAIDGDQQVGYEVDADSVSMASGYRKWV